MRRRPGERRTDGRERSAAPVINHPRAWSAPPAARTTRGGWRTSPASSRRASPCCPAPPIYGFRCCCARPAITPASILSVSRPRGPWPRRRRRCRAAIRWRSNTSMRAEPDGMARKYRVMFIGGVAYPLHLAISADWKVHYFTAAMAADPAFRAEERRFLDDMPAVARRRGDGGTGGHPGDAGTGLCRHRFRDRAGRLAAAVRGQRDDGDHPARRPIRSGTIAAERWPARWRRRRRLLPRGRERHHE